MFIKGVHSVTTLMWTCVVMCAVDLLNCQLVGLDIAFISNGYVYHTYFDVPEMIQPGCIQRAGEQNRYFLCLSFCLTVLLSLSLLFSVCCFRRFLLHIISCCVLCEICSSV